MSEFEQRITDEQLEAYLDNRMSLAERVEFEKRLAADAEATRQVELHREIEARIRGVFVPPQMSTGDIERLLADESSPRHQAHASKNRQSRRTLLAIGSAIAATVAWALVAWQWGSDSGIEPFFQPVSLARIYRQSIAQGFRPYYFCEDDERFAMTFQQRQQAPLHLASLPEDRRMVGLSYLGGLSRDTTAMLCYVGDRPVIVFIDRREVDQPVATTDASPDLYVHRRDLADLVMYEVTPLETASMLDYLELGRPAP